MWFIQNKVLLIKDNLVKRNRVGCTKCCFCGSQETIEYLFISCPFTRLLWRIVNFAYDLPPPTNITNMFGNWLNGVDKSSKARIRIGVSALCWSIWRCRNDVIFNKSKKLIFCRLSIWWHIGCSSGRSYHRQTSGILWLLGAAIC